METPNKIYLQIEADGEPTDEWTWCIDKVHDTDVKYVLAPLDMATNEDNPALELAEAAGALVAFLDKANIDDQSCPDGCGIVDTWRSGTFDSKIDRVRLALAEIKGD